MIYDIAAFARFYVLVAWLQFTNYRLPDSSYGLQIPTLPDYVMISNLHRCTCALLVFLLLFRVPAGHIACSGLYLNNQDHELVLRIKFCYFIYGTWSSRNSTDVHKKYCMQNIWLFSTLDGIYIFYFFS